MIHTLNCNGRLLVIDQPVVMGIINVNEDSFYSGSRKTDIYDILSMAKSMLDDGASILDIGAMSSRPGAKMIDEEVEINRIVTAVKSISDSYPSAIISVDTFRSKVAYEAVQAGASIINDISSGTFDTEMLKVVSSLNVPYILMHMQGQPETMQINPIYHDVVMEITQFFVSKIKQARNAGITDIIIDPGFGFGKTLEHNYTLLKHLEVFQIFDLPVLAGISRKSMVWKQLDTNPEHALNGTTALHMYALLKGADILRVHDVKAAAECIALFKKLAC